MRICFYAGVSGLGNNGGTNTVVRSAAVLREFGHDVSIVATIDRFTRVAHPPCYPEIPRNADVVIGTSYMDIKRMHEVCPNGCRKFWWMRLWDSDRISEKEIRQLASAQHTIVNSTWMAEKLKECGLRYSVVHQGVDLEFWTPGPTCFSPCNVGALIRREKWKRFGDVDALSELGVRVETPVFREGDPHTIRSWYRSLKYLFAPSEREGLANTPMEAALCGALPICRKEPSAGVGDYLDSGCAVLYRNLEEIPSLIANVERVRRVLVRQARVNIIDKIGSREWNMHKLVEVLNG
jgi:hypothetical protein